MFNGYPPNPDSMQQNDRPTRREGRGKRVGKATGNVPQWLRQQKKRGCTKHGWRVPLKVGLSGCRGLGKQLTVRYAETTHDSK